MNQTLRANKQAIRGHALREMAGLVFGRLRVIGRATAKAHYNEATWECVCECGSRTVVPGTLLRSGKSQSCGCWVREKLLGNKHAQRHGVSGSREYRSWAAARKRCVNPLDAAYGHYGARGIVMCAEWLNDPARFLVDMGPCPAKFQLERVLNNEGYSPTNCIWAPKLAQANNTRANRFLTHGGKTQTVAQWAREIGIKADTLSRRIRKGVPVELALSTKSLGFPAGVDISIVETSL